MKCSELFDTTDFFVAVLFTICLLHTLFERTLGEPREIGAKHNGHTTFGTKTKEEHRGLQCAHHQN